MAPNLSVRPLLKLFAMVSVPAIALGLYFASAGAQEPAQDATPVATIASSPDATPASTDGVEPTPDQNVRTVVRLETDPQTKPIGKGQEFEVRVLVDNVEHLAGFEFAVSYDPKRLRPVGSASDGTAEAPTAVAGLNDKPVKSRALGDILVPSPRGDGLACSGAVVQEDAVLASCVTRSPPICLGGPAGATGSGLLGAIYFTSKGGGVTNLTLTLSNLVLDDAQPPCDPTDIRVQEIPNRHEGFLAVELAKGGGGSSTLLIVIIAVIVVVVLGGGAGGYFWYRNRRPPASV